MLEQKRRTDIGLSLEIDTAASGSCILAFSNPAGDTYRTENNVERASSRQTKRPYTGVFSRACPAWGSPNWSLFTIDPTVDAVCLPARE